MADSRIDLDKRQTLRDVYRPNRYALDTRFVLRDGGTHPFAVICPGGAYQICGEKEGEPAALQFAAMGYHAFVLRYSVLGRNAPDFNAFDFNPKIFSVFIGWDWFLVRFKNQPVWLVQIASPLTFSIADKFVIIAGQITCLFQIFGVPQVVKPFLEKF